MITAIMGYQRGPVKMVNPLEPTRDRRFGAVLDAAQSQKAA